MGDEREDGDEVPGAATGTAPHRPRRLRDLDRRGRIGAALVALALVLIPAVAAAANHGRWIPQGDDALIEVRARDVGTSRNPLVGQPSTSGIYGTQAGNVSHPGPIEFELLAPTVRLLGPVTGSLAVTAGVVACCLVIAAWAVFRQAGPRAGCLAATLLALACFSAGAAGLVDPLSSSIGRFPFLAAAVLVWALLCGDLRLAPLAVAVWTFAAQQHLSLLPGALVIAAVGASAIGWCVARRGTGSRRRDRLGWLAGSALVGLVLWSPVLWQQVTGHPGNLTALKDYSGDSTRQHLGLHAAVGQVTRVLGPVPFLGRSGQQGWDLLAHVGPVRAIATTAIVALVLGAGAWWARRDRRLLAAVAMVAVLVVAGLWTGANIPSSPEQGRIAFYHWAFALSFFELLVVGWLGAWVVAAVGPSLRLGRWLPPVAVAVAVAVALGVAAVPAVADRDSDRLGQPLATSAVRTLLATLRDAPEIRRHAGGPILVTFAGDDQFVQVDDTVVADLLRHGIDARLATSSAGFAHPDHLLAACDAPVALVVSLDIGVPLHVHGRRVASVDGAPGLDRAALRRLAAQARGVHVDLGAALQHALDALPGNQGHLIGSTIAFRLPDTPQAVLLDRQALAAMAEHPPVAPALSRADLRSLLASMPRSTDGVHALRLEATLVGPRRLRQVQPDLFATC